LGLSPEDRLCVVVGNCKPGMMVAMAADALALLPAHFHLAFLGRGYESAAANFRDHTATSRLHFGHFVAPDTIVPAIRSADVGVIIYEVYSENYRCALPNGFFQLVAAGLPIVRAPLPEIEATIKGRRVGARLERLDPAILASAIIHCVDNTETLRANVAALSRELRWEAEAVRLRLLLDSVIAEPMRASIKLNGREISWGRG
jgi:glycosyltransferase involved in cell wall biosynthesis